MIALCHIFLALVALATFSGAADAANVGARRALLASAPGWVRPGADADLNCKTNQGYQAGRQSSVGGLLTVTRSTPPIAYAESPGSILLLGFAANILRQTPYGCLVEQARTNQQLWSRNMTNAAWTKSNVTTAEDATGADGTANSATRLTSTSGNATVLQQRTLSSNVHTYSVYLQRVSGSGEIDVTVNGGTGWTACTAPPSTGWSRCQVAATVTNPSGGIRIVTSGDVVIADFSQIEISSYASSPIPTTTVTVLRDNDAIVFTTVPPFGAAYTVFTQATPLSPDALASNRSPITVSDGTTNNRIGTFETSATAVASAIISAAGSTIQPATSGVWAQGVSGKSAAAHAPSDNAFAFNGAVTTNTTAGTIAAFNTVTVGNRLDNTAFWNGWIERVTIWASQRKPNAYLQNGLTCATC